MKNQKNGGCSMKYCCGSSNTISLFDLLFGKNYESDTIENRTLYDLEKTAKRAKV